MQRRHSVLTLFFVMVFVSVSHATFLLDRVVAIVNQEVITWSELYRMMEIDASPNVKAMNEDDRRKVFKENESMYLETLINYKIQLQEAAGSGIRVTEEELKEAIDGIRKKYSMNDAQFQQSLKNEGYSYDDYKKRLSEQIIISKLVNQQIRSKILLTEQDIEKFMRENKEFSSDMEAYRIRMISFKRQKEDAENSRLDERAGEVYDRLLKGESFSELAKKYSEDSSKENGGDLGFVAKANLAKEFISAISSMKVGDISKPFWTPGGLYIIRLEEKSAAKTPGEMKEEAKRALANKQFNEKYSAWMKSLRERYFIDVRL